MSSADGSREMRHVDKIERKESRWASSQDTSFIHKQRTHTTTNKHTHKTQQQARTPDLKPDSRLLKWSVSTAFLAYSLLPSHCTTNKTNILLPDQHACPCFKAGLLSYNSAQRSWRGQSQGAQGESVLCETDLCLLISCC